jgi:hypothetical protein
MKLFLLIACLSFSTALFARDIVVFSKGDSFVLGSGTETADPAKAPFLTAFKADLAQPAAFDGPFQLTDLPQYGRKVPGASGEIQYHGSFPGGFVVRVKLGGLLPGHRYILTLNGNPQRAGNDQLMEKVSPTTTEKYYDFLTVTTDANGQYEATFAVRLPAGPYDVRFYVKDTTDFKIILYHDFFKFTIG